jgi:hypothetical protein
MTVGKIFYPSMISALTGQGPSPGLSRPCFSLMPLFLLGALLWRSLLLHQIQGPDTQIALKAHVEIAAGDVEES